MTGWHGRILHIDLTRQKVHQEEPPPEVYQQWIGGRGLAGYYLSSHIRRDWDDSDMPLIFMTGPLVGTASPTSGRMCVMSRSPLTGTVGDTSVGGTLGTQLKKAGLDGLIFTGQCEQVSGVHIIDNQVSFFPAHEWLNQATAHVHAHFKSHGAVVTTGPAADHGVLFANILMDGRFAAGRNGLGAVMGAKHLKVLTVQGSGSVPVADAEGLKQARSDIFRLLAATPVVMGQHGIAHYGTGALYDLIDSRLMMPTANFRRTHFEAAGSMNAAAYKQRYGFQRSGCQGCHILCKKSGRDGSDIPEFETMAHFSALLENDDPELVVRANQRCNDLGLDTISAAATLACYAEIKNTRLKGPELLQTLDDIAYGRHDGKLLGQGSHRYTLMEGQPDVSISVKGQELPAYDPRGAVGMALAYVTSTRGACHLRAYPISHEILRKPVATDRFSTAGKARIIKIAEDINAVIDSLTACKFVFFGASLEEYAQVYTAVTGLETTARDLQHLGERIVFHERLMNAANGFTSEHDDLPPRFFSEPGSSAHGIEIRPLDRQAFLQMRVNYYRIRGLDENGRPTPKKTRELNLHELERRMDPINQP